MAGFRGDGGLFGSPSRDSAPLRMKGAGIVAFLEQSLKWIDTINEWMGRIVSYAVLIMTFSVTFEVIARYFFNRPTIWSMEINQYLLCAYIALAGGYTLLHGAHVNVEIFYSRFTPKRQAIIDLFTSVFFFLVIGVLIWKSGGAAWETFEYNEHSDSLLGAPLFPSKVVIPIGGVLFLLQGLAKLVRDFLIVFNGGAKEAQPCSETSTEGSAQ